MQLNELMRHVCEYIDTPVSVRISLRDGDGVVIGVKNIPIERIRPNFDGQGVEICLEQIDINTTEWRYV